MKKLLALSLLLTSSLSQASLWCSLSGSDLTPTETFAQMSTPYQILQLDLLSENIVQVDLTDNYNYTQKVFKAVLEEESASTINGVVLGNYKGTSDLVVDLKDYTHEPSSDLSVELDTDKRIKLKIGAMTYSCEVAGNYQETYELD